MAEKRVAQRLADARRALGTACRVAAAGLMILATAGSTAAGQTAAAAEPAAARQGSAAKRTVTIEGLRYTPESLTVRRGERIVWLNKDFFPHTVTSSAFDSKNIAPNGSWSYVANRPGRYDYRCTLHPTMRGEIIVQ